MSSCRHCTKLRRRLAALAVEAPIAATYTRPMDMITQRLAAHLETHFSFHQCGSFCVCGQIGDEFASTASTAASTSSSASVMMDGSSQSQLSSGQFVSYYVCLYAAAHVVCHIS